MSHLEIPHMDFPFDTQSHSPSGPTQHDTFITPSNQKDVVEFIDSEHCVIADSTELPQDTQFSSSQSSGSLQSLTLPQRRRVNPESLAARLGPELVTEMEKHILPGNIEMPPFSVRRDIQLRFGIDRRHIYDFFHSRGLRCIKEEKAARRDSLVTEVGLMMPLILCLTSTIVTLPGGQNYLNASQS